MPREMQTLLLVDNTGCVAGLLGRLLVRARALTQQQWLMYSSVPLGLAVAATVIFAARAMSRQSSRKQ